MLKAFIHGRKSSEIEVLNTGKKYADRVIHAKKAGVSKRKS